MITGENVRAWFAGVMQRIRRRIPDPPPHSDAWFRRQEARLQEPIKNTKRHYYKWEIIKICSLVLALWGIIRLIRLRKYFNKVEGQSIDIMRKGRTITNDGPPGAGKTFTGSNLAQYIATRRWQDLQRDYFTQRTMVAQWIRTGAADKLEKFKALEESYRFYKESEDKYIPCLVSSIPLKEYGSGRMSYQLTPEIFLQIDRAPEYTVFFNDESGLLFGTETSNTANQDGKDFWRFHRHFIDSIFVNTNQDGDQNGIQIRRSTDYNNHIYGQEWLFEPKVLLKRFERKEARYIKRLDAGKLTAARAEHIGQKLYYLQQYIKTIGFRKVTCQLATPKGEKVGDRVELILPAIGGVQYDDRSYRNLYKCKDKEIKLKGWERLTADEYDRAEYDEKINKGGNKGGSKRRRGAA